jgi:hypothetical protein
MLATQDREFVTQDQDLDLLGLSRLAAEHDQLKDAAQRQIRTTRPQAPPERKASKRRRIVSPTQGQPDRLVAGTIDFWHPTPLI